MKGRSLIRGKVGVGAVFFYVSPFFLVLLSVPFTVYLLRTSQDQSTGASTPSQSFSALPSIDISASPLSILPSETVSVSVTNKESNWYIVYFSPQDPFLFVGQLQKTTKKNELATFGTVLYQGKDPNTFSYAPTQSGTILTVAYQLKNPLGDFSSGDVMCTWDGSLFMFRRNSDNILSLLFKGNSEGNGVWERLTVCNHSGPVQMVVK